MSDIIVCCVLLLAVLVAPFLKQLAALTNPVGEGWFKIWNENAGLRVFIEVVGAITLILGVVGLWYEHEDRAEQRVARMWALGTDNRPGNSGKIPALEFLNNKGHPLAGISIPEAYLVKIDLTRADLWGANLNKANLDKANLKEANLWNANLEDAILWNANLEGATLFKAKLRRADFGGTKGANLRSVNLVCADLRRADLAHTNLRRANLRAANLECADLRHADLRDADLGLANLGRADLRDADLGEVDLGRADLGGANLKRANLRRTKNLTQSQLDKTCGDKNTKLPKDLTIKPCEESRPVARRQCHPREVLVLPC